MPGRLNKIIFAVLVFCWGLVTYAQPAWTKGDAARPHHSTPTPGWYKEFIFIAVGLLVLRVWYGWNKAAEEEKEAIRQQQRSIKKVRKTIEVSLRKSKTR